MAAQNGRVDVRIHHHIGAVTNHDDRCPRRICHCSAPTCRNLVSHAGKAEFKIKGVRALDAPVLHDLARQSARRRDQQIAFTRLVINHANNLRIGRNGIIRHLPEPVQHGIPFGEFRPAFVRPRDGRFPAFEGGREFFKRRLRITNNGEGVVFGRVPAGCVD